MKEKDIYARMQERLRPKIFLQRIESNIGLGIPDVAYTVNSTKSGWIELKVVKRFPKNGVVKVPFRPGQYAWITRYCRYSQNVFLLLHLQNVLFIFKGDEIFVSYTGYNIYTASCYDVSWKDVDWNDVFNLL